jgi:hypothetical protein
MLRSELLNENERTEESGDRGVRATMPCALGARLNEKTLDNARDQRMDSDG